MKKDLQIYLIWLALVVIWNFSYPAALPIYDVLVAMILSLITKVLNNYKKNSL